MGDEEAYTPVYVESPLGYHSCDAGILTCGRGTGRGTMSGGQFDWGGRLLKSNGGVQRLAQYGQKSYEECKRKSKPDCETNKSNRNESWS